MQSLPRLRKGSWTFIFLSHFQVFANAEQRAAKRMSIKQSGRDGPLETGAQIMKMQGYSIGGKMVKS